MKTLLQDSDFTFLSSHASPTPTPSLQLPSPSPPTVSLTSVGVQVNLIQTNYHNPELPPDEAQALKGELVLKPGIDVDAEMADADKYELVWRCPKPGCTKVYNSKPGLRYHLKGKKCERKSS